MKKIQEQNTASQPSLSLSLLMRIKALSTQDREDYKDIDLEELEWMIHNLQDELNQLNIIEEGLEISLGRTFHGRQTN